MLVHTAGVLSPTDQERPSRPDPAEAGRKHLLPDRFARQTGDQKKMIHQGVPNDSGAQLTQRGVPQVQPRHFGEHRDAPGDKSGAGVCV